MLENVMIAALVYVSGSRTLWVVSETRCAFGHGVQSRLGLRKLLKTCACTGQTYAFSVLARRHEENYLTMQYTLLIHTTPL